MDFVVYGIFALIGAGARSLIVDGIKHRTKALREGRKVGSLWGHIQLAADEYKTQRRRTKSTKAETSVKIDLASYLAQESGRVIDSVPKPVEKSVSKETELLRNVGALDVIAFSYRDSGTNEYASRTVTVRAVDAEFLEGVCHMRNGDRTFALNRIRGDITSVHTGEVRSPSKWAAEIRRLPNNATVKSGKDYRSAANPRRDWQTAVFFVGFRDARRNELEELADLAGWQVRQAFSSSLNVLVAGTLAGSSQISKAESMGIEVISEDVFRQWI